MICQTDCNDKSAPKRVLVLSVDEHDTTYDKAKERAGMSL